MDYIQNLFAERIGGNQFGQNQVLYKFEKIKRAKRAAMEAYPEKMMIDMGVGEPDAMADEHVVATLCEAAKQWENRDYADNGISAFQKSAAHYMETVFGVADLDPEKEIVHAIGSKPALAMMAQAFINPGDITLMTVPGYPIMATMTTWLGGEVYNLPLTESNRYLPDLDSIPSDILKRAKLLYLNYPNNPTGAVATKSFFRKAVQFAKDHGLIIIHDAAYGALTFDDYAPLSFLSIPGAKEVGVEIQSLSKAFNMTGWRMAFVAGHEKIVRAFASVKDNNDSGQFKAIQLAAAYALDHPEITERTAEKYSRRHASLVDVLLRVGFRVKKPKASFYLYVPIPKGIKHERSFESAEDFSQYLIREKLISTVPWDDVGPYVRFSVTFLADTPEKEQQIIDEIYNRLKDVHFEF